MIVTFVTSNPDKLSEVRRIFAEYGIAVRWSRRSLPEPQCDRLEGVVAAKLDAAARPGRAVVVEDSGLFLDGADGFPGVYSRYVYDTIGLDGVLRLLQGRSRTARFRTVAGFRLGRTTLLGVGEVRGSIAPRRRTFAELSAPEKDRLSHRGLAMRALARKIGRFESG
jgi:XTP/dITP diphosphohydrolase